MRLYSENLVKKYGDFIALDGVNITLDKGIYGLLGANGAGKSTLMNLITDNLKRTEGEILYNGEDILTLASVRRRQEKKNGMKRFHSSILDD